MPQKRGGSKRREKTAGRILTKNPTKGLQKDNQTGRGKNRKQGSVEQGLFKKKRIDKGARE